VVDKIRALGEASKSIVFSGSFRTVEEASVEIPVCEELYGRENIHFVYIPISEETSIKRNSSRRICEARQHPFPDFPEYRELKACPKDGSAIITRSIDDPKIITVRYQTYLHDTKPVLEYVESLKFPVIKVDGEQGIRDVHEEILKRIDESFHGGEAGMVFR
jgi:adenylate kinase family enzyme